MKMFGSVTTTPLVDARWIADRLDDPSVRVVEIDGNAAYGTGHLPGAIAWDWKRDVLGDFRLRPIAATALESLLSRSGIAPETTVVLYGTWPALPFWLLKLFRHADVRLLDGGRERWRGEGLPLTTEIPAVEPARYVAAEPDWSWRAHRDEVLAGLGRPDRVLVDVRTPEEFRGEHMWPGEPPGYCQRAGHIPGAKHLPWDATLEADGIFRPIAELRELFGAHGVTPEHEVIPYCTIGGRSSHAWFVLSQLLGYQRVRLYDGSWLEWAHLVDAPIER
jgi:thiosulfate/3-mercaptopyruvate sulfurtransferase